MDRTSVLLQGIDKATACGVEIGPFYSPIAAKKNGWNTIVVDFKNTQELQLVANEHTILPVCDLVFIDPVATGFSRAA